MKTPVHIDKIVAVVKLVLSNLEDHKCDFHKLFKILYFAERSHLSVYGRPITGDRFVAMKNGPVPSVIYDILKYLREGSIFVSDVDFAKDFLVEDRYHLKLNNHELNMDILSESEIECLTQSIAENRNLSFDKLTDKSHDVAWSRAEKDDVISLFDIAEAGGANEDMLNYISVTLENSKMKIA